MEVQFGASKVAKYASSDSGDTLEVIERPHGGVSAVLVDGQRSGRSAKIISNIVARKAISLLGEGVRDGAVARAAHDYLRTHRGGQVSAELQLVSVDLRTRTIVISRNARTPALIVCEGELQVFDAPSQPIGIHANTKPVILELPLQPDTYVAAFTDGLGSAGSRTARPLDLAGMVASGAQERMSAQALADSLLSQAVSAEQGRPSDDVSVLVLAVLPSDLPDRTHRLSVSFPVQSRGRA